MDFYLTKWINLHTNLSAAAWKNGQPRKRLARINVSVIKLSFIFYFIVFFFLLHVGLQDAAGDLCSLVRTHLGHRLIFPHGVRRPIGLDLVRKKQTNINIGNLCGFLSGVKTAFRLIGSFDIHGFISVYS